MRIAANITAAEAGQTCWDALVIGAGPAGALAARHLVLIGLRTLLVDRKAFPRAKVCGGCIGPHAIAALRATGLAGLLPAHGAVPTERFLLRSGGRELALRLNGGMALSREVFDAALVQAAIAAGARFLPETRATVLTLPSSSDLPANRLVRLELPTDSCEAAARVVLAADGLGHTSLPDAFTNHVHPRAKIGLGATMTDRSSAYAAGTIHMAVEAHGYVGLVRLEDGQLNVAAALEPAWVKKRGGPGPAIAELIEATGFAVPLNLAVAAWHGTIELTRRTPRPVGHRVLLLGDAAGYVEPFTGEGIGWALTAATAAPPFVECGLRCWDAQLERDWLAVCSRLVRRRQALCRGMAGLLRRPRLVRATMQLLTRFPALARPVVRRLGAPEVLLPVGSP